MNTQTKDAIQFAICLVNDRDLPRHETVRLLSYVQHVEKVRDGHFFVVFEDPELEDAGDERFYVSEFAKGMFGGAPVDTTAELQDAEVICLLAADAAKTS